MSFNSWHTSLSYLHFMADFVMTFVLLILSCQLYISLEDILEQISGSLHIQVTVAAVSTRHCQLSFSN